MKGTEYFISGIDTGCGKTYITGLLAYHLKKSNVGTITTKLVQTGCKGISEDILEHRRIMKSEILPEDVSGLTCPFVYSYPASPHLAAIIDKTPLDLATVRKLSDHLLQNYELMLTEGAGGLMVPLSNQYLTIDYIGEHALPLILVCSSKLGSLNHCLLSINLCLHLNINLHAIVYNQLPHHDELIADDSFQFIKDYLDKKCPLVQLIHSQKLCKESEFPVIEIFR